MSENFVFQKCLTCYGGKNPLDKTSYKYSKKFWLVFSGSKMLCSKIKSFGVWLQRQFNSNCALQKLYFLHAFAFCVANLSQNPSKKKQLSNQNWQTHYTTRLCIYEISHSFALKGVKNRNPWFHIPWQGKYILNQVSPMSCFHGELGCLLWGVAFFPLQWIFIC